ncbi:FAD/NAD(P)-binding domain-containing protein [Rickenella mellea]|uniref:FAD/NAD(P)-binding domain-containing protein n=1 Tax=Rickenella mellea TaxID=50990 RepID=A0A4Y7Q1M2_9AGAM|nr:FAD/NAD(P)-binding domain-containing protein [Rickenella mellea]
MMRTRPTTSPKIQPPPTESKENIVILGGGSSGSQVARALSLSLSLNPSKSRARFNIILITEREYHIHLLSAHRMLVTGEGRLEEASLIPYTSLFNHGTGNGDGKANGQLKIGKAVSIEKYRDGGGGGGEVVLESGEHVPFRYLVLATGSKWDGPLAFPTDHTKLLAWIHGWRDRFSKANDIVIVGGGAVGVELAGELRDASPHPRKKITIVHGGGMLINDTYPDKFRIGLEKSFRARDIDVVLGDYVDAQEPDGEGRVTTRRGRVIKADLVVCTTGAKPNTAFLNSLNAPSGDVLTPSGHVKTLPTLQLKAHADIFAVGDILDFPEQKQNNKTLFHARVAVPNILALVDGKEPVKEYKGVFDVMLVTNGKNGGSGYVGRLGGFTVGDWAMKTVKSKTLFLPRTRKLFGLSA